MSTLYPCPCCGQATLTVEGPGSYEECSICHWIDDYAQFEDPTFAGGANEQSLNQAKEAFARKNGGGTSQTKDTDGAPLASGDSVQLTQNLDVKGSKLKLQKGTVVKNIRIVHDDAEVIECKIEGSVIVLKTCFLRKKTS